MKIALISAINNPTGQPFEGGIPTQVWWTATKLIERGHDVTLFASGDSDANLPVHSIITESVFKNDDFRHADGKTFKNKINRWRRSHTVKKAYKNVSDILTKDASFDIIHNHALHETPLLYANMYKASVVTTLHTPPFKEIARGVKIAAQKQSSKFIAVSKALHKDWADYNVGSDYIYNGIEIDKWPYQETAKSKTAIWFGRITPQKAPHLAIQAAREAGYDLKLFGRIVDQTYYDEQVLPLLNPPHVDYCGCLDHKELAKEIGQAAVMINTPTWEEPFGLTFIEAMACGTPVVTFESGASREIITDKTGIIVPKGDIDAMSKNLQAAEKLNRRDCRNHAETQFSIDKMIDEYEDYYKKMLQS